jgi:hypothetical protein
VVNETTMEFIKGVTLAEGGYPRYHVWRGGSGLSTVFGNVHRKAQFLFYSSKGTHETVSRTQTKARQSTVQSRAGPFGLRL